VQRGGTAEPTRHLGRCVKEFAAVPTVAFGRVDRLPLQEWLSLRDSGLAGVLEDDILEEPERAARTLLDLGTLVNGYSTFAALEGSAPPWFLDLLRRGFPVARRSVGGDQRALTCEVLAGLWMRGGSVRSLRHVLEAQGLPPPGWLVRWLIALRSVHLRSRMKSWDAVSYALGFGSGDALRKVMKRLTGRPPRDVTAEHLLSLFLSRLRR